MMMMMMMMMIDDNKYDDDNIDDNDNKYYFMKIIGSNLMDFNMTFLQECFKTWILILTNGR